MTNYGTPNKPDAPRGLNEILNQIQRRLDQYVHTSTPNSTPIGALTFATAVHKRIDTQRKRIGNR